MQRYPADWQSYSYPFIDGCFDQALFPRHEWRDASRIGTQQLLDPQLLDEALQRDPAHPGVRAGQDMLRYNHGLWAWNAQAALGCRAGTWIPFRSGYGGIDVALLPNGMTYY